MEYYIKATGKADGPHDLLAVMRKVRNGTITEDTPLATSLFDEPRPAGSYKELSDFFAEAGEMQHHQATPSAPRRPRSITSLLASGTEFLKNNFGAAIYSGFFMIAWVIIGIIFVGKGGVIMPLLGIGLSYFLLGGYFYGIIRMVRGNPVTPGLILGKMGSTATNMGVVSLVVAVLMLPAVVLAALLGEEMLYLTLPVLFIFLLSIFTILSFSPLLITQKNLDFWDSMRGSLRAVTMNKGQNLGNVFGLMAMNFLFCFAMPVIFPITMAALVELYDEHFEQI